MSDCIEWLLELDIAEGKLDDLKALAEEMVAATRADEPGALVYEYYIDPDGTRCNVVERYADSAAAMVHLGNFGAKFADRFLAILTPVRFQVHGPASDELRAALSGFGAVHLDQIAGFAR